LAAIFFVELFFIAGLLLALLAFAPFLGARVTATIHPLFLKSYFCDLTLNRLTSWLYYKLSTGVNAHPYWLI
jgi:hypothetical protein